MRLYLFFLCFHLLVLRNGLAQDTIFTVKGDTILASIQNYEQKKVTYFKWGKEVYKIISSSEIIRIGKDSHKSDLSRNLTITTKQGCVLKRQEIDALTGSRIIETVEEPLFWDFDTRISISFSHVDSLYYLNLIYENNKQNTDIDFYGELTLELQNTDFLKINANSNFFHEYVSSQAISPYRIRLNANYRMTEELLNRIVTHGVKRIKISFKEGVMSHDVKEEWRNKKVLFLANCILITP